MRKRTSFKLIKKKYFQKTLTTDFNLFHYFKFFFSFSVIQKHEQEESSVLNEMARIRVDILNTKSHNDSLQKTTDSLIGELTSKDKLIEKYEMEIRQRNDQIEKKMHTVDRLNRKYEALCAGEPEEENLGPLEATIKHIQKETIRMDGDNREMEKRW